MGTVKSIYLPCDAVRETAGRGNNAGGQREKQGKSSEIGHSWVWLNKDGEQSEGEEQKGQEPCKAVVFTVKLCQRQDQTTTTH